MDAILAASHPIAPDRRSDFLADVACELAALPLVGDGIVHRVVMVVQRKYFDAPDFGRAGAGQVRTVTRQGGLELPSCLRYDQGQP